MTSARLGRSLLGVVLALLLVGVGCASYPKEEMAAAEAAIREARQAQAEKFAPAEFEQAQRDYVEADRLAREKEYKQARDHAVLSLGSARQAVDAAAKNREVFEENERRRLEEEARRAEEERIRAEEAARLAAESAAFEEAEIPAAGAKGEFAEAFGEGSESSEGQDAFGAEFEEEFGGEFEAAAPEQAPAEETPTAPAEQPPADEFAAEPDFEFEQSAPAQPQAAAQPEPEPEPTPEPEPVFEPAPVSSGQMRPYMVQRYDTLSKIAARADVYGEADLWPLIYEANRGVIRDPDLLPRTEIQIPVDPSPAERERARGIARSHVPNLWDGE